MKHESYDSWYEPATAFEAEGARVGLAPCKVCGAAILLDPRNAVDQVMLHAQWHIAHGDDAP